MNSAAGSARCFPRLTGANLNAVFAHVYDVARPEALPQDDSGDEVLAFLPGILSYANYVRRHRHMDVVGTYHLVRPLMGDFEINSEGTDCWMSMLIALEELYQLSRSEFAEAIKKIKTGF